MALNSGENISVGYGIGLQSKVDTKGQGWANQAILNQQKQAAAQQAGKQKQEEDAQKALAGVVDKIKVTKGHPIFKNKIKKESDDLVGNMFQVHNQRPYDSVFNDENFSKKYTDWQTNRKIEENQIDAYGQFDNAIADVYQNPDLYDIDQNIVSEYQKSMQLGEPTEGWKKITGNDYGYINPMDLINKTVKRKPQDYLDIWQKRYPKPPVKEEGGAWVDGSFIKDSSSTVFDEQAADVLVKQELDNPQSLVARRILFSVDGDKVKAHEILFEDLKARAEKKKDFNIKSAGGGYFMNEKDVMKSLDTEVTIRPEEDILIVSAISGIGKAGAKAADKALKEYKDGLEGSKVRLQSLSKPLSNVPLLTEDAVDLKTGKKYDGANVGKFATAQSIIIAPFTKKDGSFIRNADALEAEKQKGNVVYKPVVPAVMTDKRWDEYNEKETPITEQLLIPLAQFQSQIEQSGVPTKPFYDMADKLNSESFSKPNKSTMESQTKDLNNRTNKPLKDKYKRK